MKTRARISAASLLVLVGAHLSAQSMGSMKARAQHDLEIADAELNKVYKQALATRSEKGAAALKEAQRAWIIYRDSTCIAYGTGEEGGSLEGYIVVACSEALTKHRTEELKKLFLSDKYPY